MTEPVKLPERHYRDLLAKQLGGRIEVRLPFGRADVATDTHIYEVEPIVGWRHGAAQALQYSSQVPQRGALALYGDPWRLREIFTEMQRLPEPGLELWWLADEEFVLLASLDDVASHLPRPEPRALVGATAEALPGQLGQASQHLLSAYGGINLLIGFVGDLVETCIGLAALHKQTFAEVDELRRRVSELEGEAHRDRADSVLF